MLDFDQFDFGQLAEIELAEVEIGRSRNWPKLKRWVCSVSSFALFFFLLLCFCFSLLFLVLTHLTLHFVSMLFLFSISAGPPLPVNPPQLDNPRHI